MLEILSGLSARHFDVKSAYIAEMTRGSIPTPEAIVAATSTLFTYSGQQGIDKTTLVQAMTEVTNYSFTGAAPFYKRG